MKIGSRVQGTPARLCRNALLVLGVIVSNSITLVQGEEADKKNYTGVFPPKVAAGGAPLPTQPIEVALGASREVRFAISPKNSCFMGDIDLIMLESSWARFDELLVTLEPIAPANGPVSSKKVSLQQLLSGETVTLTAPSVSSPTPMGVFICKDSRGSGTCAGKELRNFRAALDRYQSDREPAKLNREKDFPDVVYYFNHVVVEPSGISADQEAYGKAQQERLKPLMQRALPQGYAEQLERLRRLHFTVGSVPLAEKDGALQIILPKIDLPNCTKK